MFCENISKSISGILFLMSPKFFLSLQRNQQSKQVYIAERAESTKYWPVLVKSLTIKK